MVYGKTERHVRFIENRWQWVNGEEYHGVNITVKYQISELIRKEDRLDERFPVFT